MTLSRFAPSLLLALTPAGASAAREVTADQAMSNYRKIMKPVRELDCPSGVGQDEIVVCGTSPGEIQRDRLPLPVEREAGDRVRLVPGEAPQADAGRPPAYCFSRCPGIVGMDLDMAKKIAAGIKQALERD